MPELLERGVMGVVKGCAEGATGIHLGLLEVYKDMAQVYRCTAVAEVCSLLQLRV